MTTPDQLSAELKGLSEEQFGHLGKEAGAIGRVHGDDLDGDAMIIANAANDASATHLSHGEIQQDLHEAAHWQGFLGADKEAADG